jgi:hypothetical protein
MGRFEIAGMVRHAWLLALACASLQAQGPDPAAYVGSRTCSGCHAKIYQAYARSAMGRSMSVARATPDTEDATIFNEKLKRYFRVFRQGGDLYQSEYALDDARREIFRSTYKSEYVIGSGVNGYTYIVRRGNYLFQAPISYYARKGEWDLSPGYEFADYGFNRPIAAACIGCHSGQPQPVRDQPGLFRDPPFRELAIGCENCHGPGAKHVSSRVAGQNIVNPAKLPPRLAEDICTNCHQGGDTRVLMPGRDYSDFRPGTPLDDTLAILRIPLERGSTKDADLLEHHASMQLSKCYRASEGRLSCLTCHKIHSTPAPAERAQFYRSQCLGCHTDRSCTAPRQVRLEKRDDCSGCHMPKRDVGIIAHSALTNHRIVARPDQPLPDEAFAQTTLELPDLVYVNRPSKSRALPDIVLLQAYGELMDKHPPYRAQYLALLDKLSRSAPKEPLVQAALGRKMLHDGEQANAGAIEHLSRAIDLGFTASSVYEDLGEALARAGRTADAANMLRRGVELNPYTPVLYKSLALRYITLKQYADAKKTLERYVELFPEDDFVRGLLSKVQGENSRR